MVSANHPTITRNPDAGRKPPSHHDRRPAMTQLVKNAPLTYQQKFAEFLLLLRSTREEFVIVHHPEVLGDNYQEIVESLNRLADAGKKLVIVPRNERG